MFDKLQEMIEEAISAAVAAEHQDSRNSDLDKALDARCAVWTFLDKIEEDLKKSVPVAQLHRYTW